MITACLLIFLPCAWATMVVVEFQQILQPVDAVHLGCLQDKGYLDEFMIVGFEPVPGEFIASCEPDELAKISMSPHFILGLDDLSEGAARAATKYVKYLQSYNYKAIWISLAATPNRIPCESLVNFVASLRKKSDKHIGFFTSKQEWIDNFGSASQCARFQEYPLFSFDEKEFEPFSSWAYYSLKYSHDLSHVCGISDLFEFVPWQ